MRADGEITREVFMLKKENTENTISKLREEIAELEPDEVESEIDEVTSKEKITILKYALEQYTDFDSEDDVPESVIEAFVEKIVVRKDGFNWYLRFNPEENPKECYVDGKRKNGAIVSSFCSPQHRQQSLRRMHN